MQWILHKLLERLETEQQLLSEELGNWISGTEMKRRTEPLYSLLREAPKGAVGISCSGGRYFTVAMFSAIRISRSPVFFSSKWPISELKAALDESPCSVLISDYPIHLDELTVEWNAYQVNDFYVFIRPPETVIEAYSPEGDWVGQFTSGTTGRSKLVIRSWSSIEDEVNALEEASSVSTGGIFYNMAPFHHSYGFCGGLIWPLVRGSAVFAVRDFYPSNCRKQWAALKPVVVYGLPFQYEFIASAPGADLPYPEIAFSAGGPLTRNLREKVNQHLGMLLTNNYGSTETGTICIYRDMPVHETENCAGWLLPGRAIQLTEAGMLLHSKGIMRGYWTNASVSGGSSPYLLGDKGVLRQNGSVELTGRIRPVINVGGIKVSPAVVEEALLQHTDVLQAVVLGTPNAGFYESVSAFVELRPDSKVTVDELRKHCQSALLPLEVPRHVRIVKQIPKSETGKIQAKYLLDLEQIHSK